MNFDDLKNPEIQEKLKSAKTAKDLVSIAREDGFQFSDEHLEAVTRGGWLCYDACPMNCIIKN